MNKLSKKLLIGITVAAGILLSQSGICSENLNIGGYWENWKPALNNGDVTNTSSADIIRMI
jgi:hypothetical protein